MPLKPPRQDCVSVTSSPPMPVTQGFCSEEAPNSASSSSTWETNSNPHRIFSLKPLTSSETQQLPVFPASLEVWASTWVRGRQGPCTELTPNPNLSSTELPPGNKGLDKTLLKD